MPLHRPNNRLPLLFAENPAADDGISAFCRDILAELFRADREASLVNHSFCPAAVFGSLPPEKRRGILESGMSLADWFFVAAIRIASHLTGVAPDFPAIMRNRKSLADYLRFWEGSAFGNLAGGVTDYINRSFRYELTSLPEAAGLLSKKFTLHGHAVSRLVGAGAVSAVYAVPGYALKVPHTLPCERFRAELRLLAGLRHRNLPRLIREFTLPGGRPACLLERLATDRQKVKEHPAADYLAGLAHLHANRILHGDLRLANLGLRADGTGVLFDLSHAKTGADFSPEKAREEEITLTRLCKK